VFIGHGPGTIEYEPGDPGTLVSASPEIEVFYRLIEAAAEPGGYHGIFADYAGTGATVRFEFSNWVLAYQITQDLPGWFRLELPELAGVSQFS
jgi:hypothetical protein